MLNRSPSNISREVARNRGRRYDKAVDADSRAKRMAKRPKPGVLDLNPELRQIVMSKLEFKCSPEQISGWLRVEYSHRKYMQVSHEIIYKSIYVHAKGVIHHSFTQHLRRSRPMRHSRHHRRRGDRSFTNIVNGVSIHERSKSIENRMSVGHWKGDLISVWKNTHIASLVDIKYRLIIILQLAGKDAESVHQALLTTFNQCL